MDTPLEFGQRCQSRVDKSKWELNSSHFFNPSESALAHRQIAVENVEHTLKDCSKCPMCKIDTDHSEDMMNQTVSIIATASCASNERLPCPMKTRDDYLMDDEPDWVKEAEMAAAKRDTRFEHLSVPRRGGKSSFEETTRRYFEETEKPTSPAEEVKLIDDDLDEAVEYETNQKKYDNFGSW